MSVEAVTLTNEIAARRRIGAVAALSVLVVFLMLISLLVASRNSYPDDSDESVREHSRKRGGSVASISSGRRRSLR